MKTSLAQNENFTFTHLHLTETFIQTTKQATLVKETLNFRCSSKYVFKMLLTGRAQWMRLFSLFRSSSTDHSAGQCQSFVFDVNRKPMQ